MAILVFEILDPKNFKKVVENVHQNMAFLGQLEASSYVFQTILVFTQIPTSNDKTPREKFVELLKLNQMQPRKASK